MFCIKRSDAVKIQKDTEYLNNIILGGNVLGKDWIFLTWPAKNRD